MKDNRMDNIGECAYNMDNGYVEVWFTDGNMLRIKCEEVEAALRTTEQSLAKLHRLLDNKPIEYVAKIVEPVIFASSNLTPVSSFSNALLSLVLRGTSIVLLSHSISALI